MFRVNKIYAAIVQTQNSSYLFYKLLPFEERRKIKVGRGRRIQDFCHCLFMLFYYKLTKVMYNCVLYKLVW